MSYQVIARKYRPQRFADVVGQEHVTQTLANAINQQRIAHAYLFVGPRGTGKTTIARIFAKALNATGGPKAEFDDNDPRVKEITEGRSLDVLEIDGASNRGIEEIRELRDTVKYAPASSKYKIYIIDEVHMLTKEAFNALLKTLEEPPEHVKFMFATTEPEKVLATILSRCQRFDLRRIPAKLIVQHLGAISQNEGVTIEDAALHAIARGSEGCMRDAESTLDQLISFCGNSIVESDVLSMFGLAARAQLHALAESILRGEVEPSLRQFNDLAKGGKDLGRLLGDLLNHFRNLLIYSVAKGDLSLLDAAEAEIETFKNQSAITSPEGLTRVMEILTDCEGRLRDTASKKILVEVSLIKAIQARKAISIDSVLEKLNQLRRDGGGATGNGGGSAPAPSPAPSRPSGTAASLPRSAAPGSAATATSAAPAAPRSPEPLAMQSAPAAPTAQSTVISAAASDIQTIWPNVVDSMGMLMRSALANARPMSLESGLLTIAFDEPHKDQISLFDDIRERESLLKRLNDAGCRALKLRFTSANLGLATEIEAPAPPAAIPQAAPTPQRQVAPAKPAAAPEAKKEPTPIIIDKEQFKNDPLIKKALEVFKGQIVEVRGAV
ncbi:MAG TPA: DNA polymerase III subunit gamma/tau [Methylomirabilota bacterium]|nr:DNA polymerase III subunit gamma/tau [Methylomirabilota bacterium]